MDETPTLPEFNVEGDREVHHGHRDGSHARRAGLAGLKDPDPGVVDGRDRRS